MYGLLWISQSPSTIIGAFGAPTHLIPGISWALGLEDPEPTWAQAYLSPVPFWLGPFWVHAHLRPGPIWTKAHVHLDTAEFGLPVDCNMILG